VCSDTTSRSSAGLRTRVTQILVRRERPLKLAQSLLISAVCLITPMASAQDSVCPGLLGSGVFDKRNTNSGAANRDRLKSVYCREESKTKDGAKKVEGSAGYDGASLGYGQSESEYEDWRSKLCTDFESESSSQNYLSESVQVASQAILNAFIQCVNRTGLTQYAERESDDVYNFNWHLKYIPPGDGPSKIAVAIATLPAAACLYNDKVAPSSVTVGPSGVNLTCTRNPCVELRLTANSRAAEPLPHSLYIGKRDTQTPKSSPYKIVANQHFEMTAPFSIPLPRGMECVEKHSGSWRNHCPNPNSVGACIGLAITDGLASSGDFDHNAYGDNCGEGCTYTVECRPPVPPAVRGCETPPKPRPATHVAATKSGANK
jgi:hypothetical protein